MKPSIKQIKIIQAIKSNIQSWLSTNDIDSPTIASDINAFLWMLSNDLSEKEREELYDNIRALLSIVRKHR